MVDQARRVDVDGSMKDREWNTDEFYAVLNQHTEQVRDKCVNVVIVADVVDGGS